MSKAVLVDITKCLGCGSCTVACKLWNDMEFVPSKPATGGKEAVLCDANWTVVQKHIAKKETGTAVWRFVKNQCLHCDEPACASSCLVGALRKTPEGPVVYYPDLCVGCRYCMVACPFNIPKYEWGKVLPRVSKCQMCAGRIERSEMPACVSVCPAGVFTFGEKDEILQKGREAIKKGDYIKTIYGEKEVGGTSWLYISDVPFEELGFDTNVPDRSLPSLTWKLLRKVPMILVLWTLILAVIYRFNKYRAARSGESDD